MQYIYIPSGHNNLLMAFDPRFSNTLELMLWRK